ncbi:MAG: M61 family metallopeptidase [Hormoscilla sp. SP5CHS1]|nr:M61 family metallopeptidase [Hormoscilla sp. SP5CHS1]
MTEAILTETKPTSPTHTAPEINYQVAMPQPSSHLFEVTLRISGWRSPVLDLKMPVWTPGSYLVREYARHLQEFAAAAGDESALSWRKLSKNHWQIETPEISEIVVHYRIFAAELTVRTNHLDATHGYFNGAALFLRVVGWEQTAMQVKILCSRSLPKSAWKVTTMLPAVRGKPDTFWAADFDTLVDSPFEIGTHRLYHFEVLGKPHELAIWGEGNANPVQMIPDIEKIIQEEARLFGGLPYDRYVFLLHMVSQGRGGLEHKHGCSLIYNRFGFRDRSSYQEFMQLVAHEFFHLWNVKRLRPQGLEVFDYDRENYTPCLWFCEGTTSYYDLVMPMRAGIYDVRTFLQELGKEINRLQTSPGRLVQPASESSWDAWIKLYRRHANSENSQISYYLKGELVSLLLDLLIRARHNVPRQSRGNEGRSLDDVMQKMWQEFGKREIGFTEAQLQQEIESVAGVELGDFWGRYIDGTEELPFDQYLSPFGLRLKRDCVDKVGESFPYLGVRAKAENGRELIKFVASGSPAQQAGIDHGDELLAIDGIRVKAEELNERLKDYSPGDTIKLSVFHEDRLRTELVTLGEPQPNRYQVVPVEHPTDIQAQNFTGWLGVPLSQVFD